MVLPLLIGGAAMLAGGLIQQGATNRYERERAERIRLQDEDILEARRTPQETTHTSTADMAGLVRDAEVAGFNPLTVLRAGGLASYTNTHTVHPNLFPIRGLETGATGQSPLGASISGIGGLIAGYDYGASQRNTLEAQLLEAQIANVNTDTNRRAAFASSPGAGFGSSSYGGAGYTPGNPAGVTLGAPAQHMWEPEYGTVTNPLGGDWWWSNPYWSDIETGGEARYGDVGGAVMSPFTFGADLGHSMAKGVEYWTGQNPRQFGQWLKQGVSDWAHQVFNPPGANRPLQITVGGPNQT